MKEIAIKTLILFLRRMITPTTEELDYFTSLLDYQECEKNERLIRSGAYCKRIYFLSEGFVKYELNQSDNKQVIHVAGSGVWVSDFFSFYSDRHAITDVYTIVPCKLLWITKERLEELYNGNKTWANFGRKIAEHAVVNQIMDRIRIQTLSPEERYLSMINANPEITKFIKLGDLAEILGIAQETLSRIRKRLK